MYFKNIFQELETALATPAKGLGSVPSIHMAAHNCLYLEFWGIWHPFLASMGPAHTRYTNIHATPIHIKIKKKSNIYNIKYTLTHKHTHLSKLNNWPGTSRMVTMLCAWKQAGTLAQGWWWISVIPVLAEVEDHTFYDSLGYTTRQLKKKKGLGYHTYILLVPITIATFMLLFIYFTFVYNGRG